MRSRRARNEKPLHCIRTARPDVELIEERLKAAKRDYEARYGKEAD
jgi:hypothetical protein